MRLIYLGSRVWYALALIVTAALMAALAVAAPQQIPVVNYKLALAGLGGLAGYWLDRTLYPYSDPSSYLRRDWRQEPDADRPDDADYPVASGYLLVFGLAMLRQALLVAAGMLGVGLGL